MTATASRPSSPATGQRRSPAAAPTRTSHLPLAELALAAVSVAIVFGFARLFAGWSFFWPLLAVAAYAHLATMVLRRRGMGVGLAFIVSFAGWMLLTTWLWFADTTAVALPTGRTLDALDVALRESWQAFQNLAAPVPTNTGFLVTAALALFFAVFLADWAAFRLWSSIEALVPAVTLFVFCALLGADQQRISSALVFGASVLFFLLAHRVARLETQSGWLTDQVEHGSRWLLRTGVALGAVAVIGGALIGPHLPGAQDSALIDWRGQDKGPSSRVTVSPLVDIRQRLVDQSDVEVFTVRSDERAYWRLTALDTFDGQIWRSGGRYASADGDLPAQVPEGVASRTVSQTFDITGLSALWLPAAFQPVAIRAEAGVRYQPESATLIVDTKYASSDNFVYQVDSQLPDLTPELLDQPSQVLPESMLRYLDLPADFSTLASGVAGQVVNVSGATTPYEKAMALQSFFRDEGPFADDAFQFTYDLRAQPGHGEQAIDDFLRTGRGYCEQFAGAYAAMARSIGLPARVAVGFTWGDQDPGDPSLYRVRGRFAHAWPEVWLGEQVGWVAFEPTPGRGAPGMDAYASVAPAQAGQEDPGPTTTTTAPSTTTTAPGSPTTADAQQQLDELRAEVGARSPASTSRSGRWTERLTIAGVVLLLLALVYLAVVPAWLGWRRHRRRRAAVTPGARVRWAWRQSGDDLALLGVVRRPHETHDEFAARAGARLPALDDHLRVLAGAADAAAYGPEQLDDERATEAEDAAAAVRGYVRDHVTRRRLVLDHLDPRPLWPHAGGGPRRAAVSSRGSG